MALSEELTSSECVGFRPLKGSLGLLPWAKRLGVDCKCIDFDPEAPN